MLYAKFLSSFHSKNLNKFDSKHIFLINIYFLKFETVQKLYKIIMLIIHFRYALEQVIHLSASLVSYPPPHHIHLFFAFLLSYFGPHLDFLSFDFSWKTWCVPSLYVFHCFPLQRFTTLNILVFNAYLLQITSHLAESLVFLSWKQLKIRLVTHWTHSW